MLKRLFLVLVVSWSIVVLLPGQSTDSLVVSENGNVGIGTETPQAKLEVNGNFKALDAEIRALIAAEISGLLNSSQLDYIYAGNQVIVDYWTGSLTTTPVELARGYVAELLGAPRIPNPDPDHYTLYYYFSAIGGNNTTDPAYVNINGINILEIYINGGYYFRGIRSTNYFTSWTDFPPASVGVWGNGLMVTMKTVSGTTTGYLWGLSVHYVYIRNGVDYPKLFP